MAAIWRQNTHAPTIDMPTLDMPTLLAKQQSREGAGITTCNAASVGTSESAERGTSGR